MVWTVVLEYENEVAMDVVVVDTLVEVVAVVEVVLYVVTVLWSSTARKFWAKSPLLPVTVIK